MKQAALCDGFAFDPFPLQHDDVAMPEVDVGGGEIAEAPMVAAVVVVLDEPEILRSQLSQFGPISADAGHRTASPKLELCLD
jgi:hypothetical protein